MRLGIEVVAMEIGFSKFVRDAFEFLEIRYGFRCAETSPSFVKYEAGGVFVNVVYDRTRSFEIRCMIGREDDRDGAKRVPFDLGEIMRANGVPLSEARSSFQVSAEHRLQPFIAELASSLEEHGTTLLRGDDAGFDRVAAQRRQECDDYAIKRDVARAKATADQAWTAKDYPKVVEALASVRTHLSAADEKRLELAERRL
ncbi:MAG: hypothetical protein FKY71_15485 [Spiribacter salinus]|uniref:Uncharacterized protein n=1 Tax=Spiribacter salinus TaxID=1335746 RepID=A0A540VMY4_9GAMM|nr:MAG: hypothetical protein FKY71_15485 [Spiribacter salinus]